MPYEERSLVKLLGLREAIELPGEALERQASVAFQIYDASRKLTMPIGNRTLRVPIDTYVQNLVC